MSKPLAIRAAYSDLKIVKTRQVVQLIFELPISDFDAAYEVLGGLPTPDGEKWFAIAAIQAAPPPSDAKPEPVDQPRPARAKREWRDVSPTEQAGIRCGEPRFEVFLRERDADTWFASEYDAAECVRMICGVDSRADLAINQKARVIWHQLDEQYQAWMRVGA